MSLDWSVHCVDCGVSHGFDDANRKVDLMKILCAHAGAIGALAPLLIAATDDVKIMTPYGQIDTAWFADHVGHQIVPIDEHGRVLGQCKQWKGMFPCRLEDGHDGDHTDLGLPPRRAW